VLNLSEEKKMKDSNELLNILLIILGILYLLNVILYFLALFGIAIPSWLVSASGLTTFAGQSILSAALGFWCIVAGIGMFGEEEWALGQGLMITSLLVVDTLMTIINWFLTATFDFAVVGTWITIVVFLVGLLGFFWLLFTMKRYD
jgi:hypothetical protein